jgi:membrane protease YdiL (CAAX protease family)
MGGGNYTAFGPGNVPRRSTPTPSGSISMPRLISLHLIPGLLILLIYLLLALPTVQLGYPPVMALLIAAFVGVAGFQLGHLLMLSWKRNGNFSLRGVVLYTERLTASRFTAITIGVTAIAILALLLLSPADKFLLTHLFHWLPAWYNYYDPSQYSTFSHSTIIVTAVARFIIDGLVLPVVEELYFRGYLLPRIPRAGSLAVWLNAGLFTIYHFWQPFNYLTIFVFALLLAYTVKRTRAVWIGISIHVLLNLIGGFLALMTMLNH